MMSGKEGTGDVEMTGMRAELREGQMEQALGEFRASVKGWSEASLRQSSLAATAAPRLHGWQRPLAWAMGVLLAAGAASGAIYERHHQEVLAWQAHQLQLEQQQRAQAARRAAEMDQLLANVDRDVSQEVPDALEPLAQMMTDGGSSK